MVHHFFTNAKLMHGVLKTTVISFLAVVALAVYDFVLPVFTETLTANYTIIGLIFSLFAIAGIIAEIPIGLAVDKYGRIKILVFSLFGIAGIGIIYFFTNNLLLLAVLSLVFGTIEGMFWIPSMVLIRDFSPHGMFCRAEGIYMTGTQFGWVIGPILAGIAISMFSERHGFLLITLFMLLAGVISLILFRGKKFQKQNKGHGKEIKPGHVLSAMKEYFGINRMAGAAFFLTIAIYTWDGIEWVFVTISGIQRFNFPDVYLGLLLGAMMAVQSALFYATGYFMDRIDKKYIITVGFGLLFTGSYFMFLSTNPAVFVLSALVATASVPWVMPGIEALVTEIIPKKRYGAMSGVYDMSKDIGLAAGPFVGGLFASYMANPLAAFLFVTIMAGLALVVSGDVFWPEHHEKNRKFINIFRFRREKIR